jgi:GNAT superfamily N-acetyltransferase
MFWTGKVDTITQLYAFMKQNDLAVATDLVQPVLKDKRDSTFRISVGSIKDCEGIAKLLNEWFEKPDTQVKTDVTAAWVRASFLRDSAIWVIAKDPGGTVRGCVTSFRSVAPYPNALGGCGASHPWGIVDWFCVHPLWRSKGVGSLLLETLDFITLRIGRKAHIFLKEGPLLPLPNVPVYTTVLLCRRAGNPSVTYLREEAGLTMHRYHTKIKGSNLPLYKVEGIRREVESYHINDWEDALDRELPPCWVFVTMADKIDKTRGWQIDSLVSMYAFRWIAGKWFGTTPNAAII